MWYVSIKWCDISSYHDDILKKRREGFKELQKVLTALDAWREYLRKRLYKVGDIVQKLICEPATC